MALLHHFGKHCLHAIYVSPQVDGQSLLHLFPRLLQKHSVSYPAGIIDPDIDTAMRFDDLCEGTFHLLAVGHVGAETQRGWAVVAATQFLRYFLGSVAPGPSLPTDLMSKNAAALTYATCVLM